MTGHFTSPSLARKKREEERKSESPILSMKKVKVTFHLQERAQPAALHQFPSAADADEAVINLLLPRL